MTQQPYRVLARKYRPNNFDTLIGQDALVRTLTNAITHNRVAQAFMLTGVRGVGKTTTARIIAKALNCIGTDGKGDATPSPCGECSNCVAISEDRHVDVKEIDAASHNGVDQVREISENIHYRPSQARYSIIILDEVHMLTTQAFNAILKTLEEPPAHAKFIFATTEIRKVPVTVLSRCQRFDLRRVPLMQLKAHYEAIAASEQVEFDEEAISLIARAADGSVRDGLSLLDQAIALDGDKIALDQVRIMLGLADRAFIWEIYEAMLAGKVDLVLDKLQDLHHRGADPLVITHDMLDITHFLTRAKMSS
ncbi:MAG: DNA polymerase III subunit gamma/tau, partial [Alphaproteobacteria bacterium]